MPEILRSIDNLLLRLRFRVKGILIIAIPLIFEILFVFVLSVSYQEAERESLIADHSKRVLTITDSMTAAMFAVGAAIFLSGRFKSSDVKEGEYDGLEMMQRDLIESLSAETKNNPEEFRYANAVIDSMEALRLQAKRYRDVARDPLQLVSGVELRAAKKNTQKTIDKLSRSLSDLTSYEQSTMSGPRLVQAQRVRQQLHVMLYSGVVVNILVSIGLALVFSRQITDRLSIVSRNAVSMSKQEELKEVVVGADELADLDRLLHQLADMLVETNRREKAMIEENDMLRKKFFSMVTHDLRGPLTTFKSFLQTLEEDDHEKVGKKALTQMQQNLDFVIGLSNDLLEIGRLESGHVQLAVSKFACDELIDECCSVLEPVFTAKSIQLAVSVEPPDHQIQADFVRIKQVLVNLLSNAIKFSPVGATVKVAIVHAVGHTRLSVKDSGPGIPKGDAERIFELYAQSCSQPSAASTGFGVGLSIVKTIVETHGGTVGVVSSEGQGSEFWFQLPDVDVDKLAANLVAQDTQVDIKAHG